MMTGVIGVAECRQETSVLTECILEGPPSHEQKLFQKLEEILAISCIKQTDMKGIIVGIGPGSFTGLRVGLAAAKGMVMSLGIPLAGVSSLDVLEQSLVVSGETVVPLIDARRGEIYGQIQGHIKAAALAPEDWCKRLDGLPGRFVLVGDGAERYEALFMERLASKAHMGPRVAKLSRGMAMLQLGIQQVRNGGDDLASLIPQYLRVSDAEIGFRRRIDSSSIS